MKNKKLLFGIFFACLTILCLGFSPKANINAFATGSVTITLNTNGGSCEETSLTTDENGCLTSLPTPIKNGYIFSYWKNSSGERVTTSTVFEENETITAVYNTKIYKYTISSNDNIFTIIGQTNYTTVNYSLTATSLAEAITLISNDMISQSTEVTITFNDITLTENLNLSFYKSILTGTINLNSHLIVYTAPERSSTIKFTNFSATSTNSQNQIIFSGTNSASVTLNNCSFNASHTDETFNDYSIYFENSNYYISIANKISHQTKYLYNHTSKISASVSSLDLSNQTNGKISITFPYTLDGSLIFSNILSATPFNFVSLQDNYTCSANFKNASIYLSVQFNIEFDFNGGTLDQSQSSTLSSKFNQITALTYPIPTKNHYTLNGFAGVINIDQNIASTKNMSNTYYFDATALENFYNDTNENDIYDKIATYFSSEIPTSNNGFTYYQNNASDINFKAVNLMLELNQTPSFIALWSETNYTITFIENGGTEVSDISGTNNTEVNIPTSTRTGYNFDGWYLTDPTSDDFTEDSKVTITNNKYTMTDENLTFYAKWTPVSYKLTINPSNGLAPEDVNVYFDTLLSTLSQMADGYYTKTGYSLINWYKTSSNELIDLETFKMTNGDLEIHADWQINQYTINLYNNHDDNNSLFATITKNYNESVMSLSNSIPEIEGFTFQGWYKDRFGQFRYTTETTYYLPKNMPAENLDLYAYYTPNFYTITFYIDTNIYRKLQELKFGDSITTPENPTKTGYTFKYWCVDETLTQQLDFDKMPSRNVTLYAKFEEKLTIFVNENSQSYMLSENGNYKLDIELGNFVIQYLVDGQWTINPPTKKGTYDVKITRNEDSTYKRFETTVFGGLVITPNTLDLGIYTLILYSVATIELICSIIILLFRKQRKTYLTFAIILPFGIVSKTGFINFIISLVLAVFGFVLIVVELTKLKHVNNEIAKISTENKEYVPPDVSQNSSISKKVEIILEQNGFVSADKYNSDDKDSLTNENADKQDSSNETE